MQLPTACFLHAVKLHVLLINFGLRRVFCFKWCATISGQLMLPCSPRTFVTPFSCLNNNVVKGGHTPPTQFLVDGCYARLQLLYTYRGFSTTTQGRSTCRRRPLTNFRVNVEEILSVIVCGLQSHKQG